MRFFIRSLLIVITTVCATRAPAPLMADTPVGVAGEVAELYVSEGYQLVWADEFDTPGRPDPSDWTYEEGFVRNDELQWYQPDNARCEDGMLIIEARRERKANPGYQAGSRDWRRSREHIEYTSSALITRGLHQWQYGRFEMRARIDTRPGLWPAWWMLGVRGRWPANGEIDIMEYYRGILLANVAWAGDPARGSRGRVHWDDVKIPLPELGDADWPRQFHVWRMDWDKQQIVLSVDGKVLNTTDLSEAVNPAGQRPEKPFQQPHYMLINLAIGGTQGGDPSGTEFPAKYEVDYVRVYQRPADVASDQAGE
jgi:beta-glucanase (GH16 family)